MLSSSPDEWRRKRMRTFVVGVVLSAAIISAGCGATRKVTSTVAPGPAITGATLQFMDRDHGKDAGSAVDVWLLRGSNEMAHLHSVGTKFDDRASIAPMALPMSGTFSRDGSWRRPAPNPAHPRRPRRLEFRAALDADIFRRDQPHVCLAAGDARQRASGSDVELCRRPCRIRKAA